MGGWSIRKELPGGGLSTLAEGGGAAVGAPGARVELEATCSGSREGLARLAFSVNGKPVGAASDEDGPRSFRGLAVIAQSVEGESEVAFDDAVVRSR